MLSGALLTVCVLAYLTAGLLCAVAIEGYGGSRGYRSTLRTGTRTLRRGCAEDDADRRAGP